MVQSASHEQPRELRYELDLLHRMERVVADGTPLTEYPLFEKYSYWSRFVQFVFSADIKRFSAVRSFEGYLQGEGGRSMRMSFKGLMVSLMGIFATSVGWVVARLSKPEVIVFGIDRVSDLKHKADFRIRSLHSFLAGNKISYFECFHTVFNISFLKNIFVRGRFAFYLEALDARFALMRHFGFVSKRHDPVLSGLDIFTEEERKFVSYVVKKYLGERELIEYRVKELARFVRDSGAKAVWAIDDARYYHDIALAAKIVGVPSYAFQHGHFTQYHVGWLKEPRTALQYICPDYLVVWSEYWKKELMRLGGVFPNETLIVGGYPEKLIALPSSRGSAFLVLIPHETDSPKQEVALFMRKILDSVPGSEIVMKLRSDHSAASQMEEYGELAQEPRMRFITDLSELSSRPHVVVGVYSSFLYDMVRAKVPTAIMETSMDYGKGMIENGLAETLYKARPEAVVEIAAQNKEVLGQRAQKLDSAFTLNDTFLDIADSCGIRLTKRVG